MYNAIYIAMHVWMLQKKQASFSLSKLWCLFFPLMHLKWNMSGPVFPWLFLSLPWLSACLSLWQHV